MGEIHRSSRYVVSREPAVEGGASVVVKVVRAEARDAAAASRLRQEYELLASLDVPGVVRPIAFRPVAGRPALILEDAGPQHLKEWLRRREVSAEDFLAVAVQLAEVLVRLHAAGIIHRDINPWNVVMDPRGRATLIDFEAATTLAGDRRAGVPPRLDAALSYVAPEETGRMNRLVDRRADLYSLGAVFYDVLTGRPPFVSSDPVDLVHAHLARPPVPAFEVNPALPRALSDIVLRLLAKMPEARYQSARALLHDLREARARLAQHGAIAPFELGLLDLAEELPLPERLYQRDEQRRALLAAWDRAAAGGSGVVVLAGPAGIGKSALVAELRGPVARRQGLFLTAKLDLQQGPAPHALFAEAFRALVDQLLALPPAESAVWRARLAHALGDDARLMTDLAPELERLVGAPPPPPPGAAGNQGRLHRALEGFVRALATREHPLLLFLDDVQWADTGSLGLLEGLATAPSLGGLLIVVAVRRDEEAGLAPAVATTLDNLSRAPAFRRFELPPLAQDAVVELCRDALRCDAGRAAPLAALILGKTAGNPFFIRRMLRFLHQSGLLTFDASRGTWTWELAEIEQVEVSENVVDLLLVVLRALPRPVQEVCKSAACIGHTVPSGLLASVCGLAPDDATSSLWTAVRAGLLVPLDPPDQTGRPASFRFAHDRIRQAAYLLLGDEASRAVHLRIGRQLLQACSDEHLLDERIYAIVDQLDRGLPLVTDPRERLRLSQLDLRAARKALASSASGPALAYLERALALLPEDAWTAHRRYTFSLYREAVLAVGVAGDPALADGLFRRALAQAESVVEKAALYTARIHGATTQSAKEAAVALGIAGVRLFGIELPSADPEAATAREMAAIRSALHDRTPDRLLEAPHMERPEDLACLELMCTLLDATYFHRPDLFAFVAARMVNMSLEHGNSAYSAQAYLAYAVILGTRTQDYPTAHAFGRLALDLAARFDDPVRQLRVLAAFAAVVDGWMSPLAATLQLNQRGQRLALEVGDTYFAAAFSLTDAIVRLHQGADLGELATQLRAAIAPLRAARFGRGVEEHLVVLQVVRALQGLPLQRDDLEAAGTELDERGYPRGVTEESGKLPEYQALRLGVAFHLRDFGRAFEIATAIAGGVDYLPRFVEQVEHNFFTSLTLAARCARASPGERREVLAAIATNQERLGLWAKSCPESHRHKHLLVAAELARLEGKALEASELYDQAITAAARERFLQDEALANELCGRFYLAQGRKRIATVYLSAAVAGYARWGARGKAEALEAEFVELTGARDGMGAGAEGGPTHDQTGGVALDLLALYRAAEAVSSEVVLPRMLGKLMEVCLATAGAQRGAFVVEEDGQLFVRAVGGVAEPTSLQRTPVEASPHLPARAIQLVRRTGEPLVVGDASVHEDLASDPYIAGRTVRSLLALPILRQTRLMGVLYLENNLATRGFTPERVRLLTTLSSQIATALQNSLLFEQLSHEIEERKRAEAAVRFLADAGATLAESLDYPSTLKKLVHLAVPALADWCVVHVVEQGVVRWVASAHVDPEKEQRLADHQQAEIGRPPLRHIIEVFESGAPVLYPEVDREVVERYVTGPQALALVEDLGTRSSMILPLRAQGRFLGAMTLASHRSDRRFGAPDLAAAQELARRAAMAIDNARLYREAREAIRLRDEFLSIASHELSTPITSLRVIAESFEASREVPAPALFAKIMSIVSRQSQRLATLVSDLFDVAQIPAGLLKLRRERVELGPLVRETVELHRGDLDRARCRLTMAAEPGLVGHWDRGRLQQVVTNLLSNAMKFAAGKPVEVTVARADDRRARLTVEDHGMGIPPERLPHIFGRFERAVSATHFGGLGLGLYVVHVIVEGLGGTVGVTSVQGEGARFTVDLPLSDPALSDPALSDPRR